MTIREVLLIILEWIWCFPQMFLGWLLRILFFRKKDKVVLDDIPELGKITYYVTYNSKLPAWFGASGVSLGRYILFKVPEKYTPWVKVSEIAVRHEYGHTKQSRILGPLYLIIVGIPSFTFNIMSRFNRKFASDYYNRFPENWADKLGYVER